MAEHVALLRGINVGGIRIKMADLAATLRAIGFENVTTVLASGNVVFEGAGRAATIKRAIEDALSERFGYDAWIVLIRPAALRAAVDAFPFAESDAAQSSIVFGSDARTLAKLARFARDGAGDEEQVEDGDGVLYWAVPRGRSTETPFAKELAKAAYKSTTTTRNIRTLRKILTAAEA